MQWSLDTVASDEVALRKGTVSESGMDVWLRSGIHGCTRANERSV